MHQARRLRLVVLTAALAGLVNAVPARSQSAPDPSMMRPVERWIDAYNSASPLPEDIFTDNVTITDEFSPFVWLGMTGERQWAGAIDGFMKAGQQHVSVGAPQSFHATRDGASVSFVLPATLSITTAKRSVVENALWLFVLVRDGDSWKIAVDNWTQNAAPAADPTIPLTQERGVLFVTAEMDGVGPMLVTFDPGGSDMYTGYARDRLGGAAPKTVCLASACFPAQMQFLDGDPNQLDPKHDVGTGTIAGNIGPALLQHYVATIDYAASTLTLVPAESFTPPPGAKRVPLTFDTYGLPVMPADVENIPAKLELDVRAPSSMLFRPFSERAKLPQEPLSVRIAGFEVRNAAFRFSTATSGKFASTDVDGLLGNNVLSHFVVTLDLTRRAAYFSNR